MSLTIIFPVKRPKYQKFHFVCQAVHVNVMAMGTALRIHDGCHRALPPRDNYPEKSDKDQTDCNLCWHHVPGDHDDRIFVNAILG